MNDLWNYRAEKEFSQKHLLCLQSYTKDEILQILSLALALKQDLKNGFKNDNLPCSGQTLAMIFAKSSTRTRVSFETGFYQLGGQALFLSSSDIQLGRGEPIEDTAKVLGRMVDGIMIRTFSQQDVELLAQHSGIPVINGLTDSFHPCQALADLMSYYESKKTLSGKLVYIGDGNNVAHSLMIACSKVGLDIALACPDGYQPNDEVVQMALQNAKQSASKVEIFKDPLKAAVDADCLYTDVWTSMGQEAQNKQRLKDFEGFQINDDIAKVAKGDYIFQHCLPAHRGEEVSASIIDGKHSIVFDQAENRLHVQKAVMQLLMSKK